MAVVGVAAIGGCAAPAEQPTGPNSTVSPSTDVRGEIEDEADSRDQDAHAMHVVAEMGYTDNVDSHSFAGGVIAIQMRGDIWATDMRIWLCNVLIDEFRDSDNVGKILITQARLSTTASDREFPPVRWNRPDVECTAEMT